MKEIEFDEFFKNNFDTTGIEDNIYNQIAKDLARGIDIDLAKTPLVDILTGYTRYKIQELEIERLNNIINEFDKFLFGELQTYGGGGIVQEYYDKLQELKGSSNNE